jgi:hypothetical protein
MSHGHRGVGRLCLVLMWVRGASVLLSVIAGSWLVNGFNEGSQSLGKRFMAPAVQVVSFCCAGLKPRAEWRAR